MDATTLRGRLHEYIERADNEHIAAIYVLLGKEIEPHFPYDETTLKMLYERVANDEKGNSKSYSAEETFSYIRNQKANE